MKIKNATIKVAFLAVEDDGIYHGFEKSCYGFELAL